MAAAGMVRIAPARLVVSRTRTPATVSPTSVAVPLTATRPPPLLLPLLWLDLRQPGFTNAALASAAAYFSKNSLKPPFSRRASRHSARAWRSPLVRAGVLSVTWKAQASSQAVNRPARSPGAHHKSRDQASAWQAAARARGAANARSRSGGGGGGAVVLLDHRPGASDTLPSTANAHSPTLRNIGECAFATVRGTRWNAHSPTLLQSECVFHLAGQESKYVFTLVREQGRMRIHLRRGPYGNRWHAHATCCRAC